MLKKLFQIAVFCMASIPCVLAEGFIIYCPLDIKTDDHLYRDFVQNCGARVEDINPEVFQVTFASLHHVEAADNAMMNTVVQAWLVAHQPRFKDLSLDLSDVKLEGPDIFVTTDFIYNALYELRDELQKLIHATKFPSGKVYDLNTNTHGFHVFSILTADTKGLTAHLIHRATQTLQDRLQQAKLIYHADYTQIYLKAPVFKPL